MADDWMMPVTITPVAHPARRLSVTAATIERSFLPAADWKPSDMYFMPRRKRLRPPKTSKNIW